MEDIISQDNEVSSQGSDNISTIDDKPKKSRKKLLIIGILPAIGLCICAGICAFFIGSGIYQSAAEKENITKVIDEFMNAMVEKDTEVAYSFFSERAASQVPISNVEEMITGANYALFDEYEMIEIQNISAGTTVNVYFQGPKRNIANVSGIVKYKNNYTGSFTASLENEEGLWRVETINITVPPDKLNDYIEKNR